MKRTILAVALIVAGATGAAAQGYGGYGGYRGGPGYHGPRHGPGPVIVVPPRHGPVFAHPRRHWRPWHRWHHYPRWYRPGW